MKRIIIALVTILLFAVTALAQTPKTRRPALPSNIATVGAQDSDTLLNNSVIKARMKTLLGNEYGSFMESFETINPVKRQGSYLFSSGCLIHACTHLESAIAVDLVNKTIHTAIFRQDEKTRYFNEGAKATPKVIRDWANNLRQINDSTNSSQVQKEEEETRGLWDTAFFDQGKKSTNKKKARRNYRIVTPNVPVMGVAADTVIGVTLWRLRPSRKTDAGERIIGHEGPETTEWLPERVSSTGKLSEGDRIRISIEAARDGYLYVVNQEQYADGSKGEPYLIFPTTRTRGGDNSVKAGRVIEIPAQDDGPPYFTLKRTRTDQVGENVTVLVSPTPIEGLTITDKAQRISADTLALWEKSWGAQAGRLEMTNGEGKAWTKQEKDAGADATRSLKESEPAPQTIYYRPGASSTDPVLIKVQLQYARAKLPVKKQR